MMNRSHFVLGILGALLTGINSAAPLLSSGAQTWVHVGTAVCVPVLVFLGITSVSALATTVKP